MPPKKEEAPPVEQAPAAEDEPPVEPEEDEEALVSREPVIFPPVEQRLTHPGPVVIVVLDDPAPQRLHLDEVVLPFLQAFFGRPVERVFAPCMTAGIPPRPPKVKDLLLHL